MKKLVIYFAWGEKYINEVLASIKKSPIIQQYDILLITDEESKVDDQNNLLTKIVRADFKYQGLLRKTELYKFLPESYDVFLFLDSDTHVLEDISLGFEQANKYEIAVAQSSHYSLDYFWGFDKIMKSEGLECKGQIQYNTGVIFFKNSEKVRKVFQVWMELGEKYGDQFDNDQPYFSLAMEQLNLNPYTLTICYNYRGFGDAISGIVRIWHSHGEKPAKLNEFEKAWPPRQAWPGKMKFPETGFFYNSYQSIKSIERFFRKLFK